MPDTSDLTEGAQPQSDKDVDTPTPTNPAATPSTDDANTPSPDVPTTEKEPINIPQGATIDEIIASIPDETLAALTPQEIADLSAGDKGLIARVLRQPTPQAATPTPEPEQKKEEPVTTPEEPVTNPPNKEKGIERISLRGLSPKDQKAVADAIAKVRDGTYSSFEEARAATTNTNTEPDKPSTQPKVDVLKERLNTIEQEQKAATAAFDTAKIATLNEEFVKVSLELRAAESESKTEPSTVDVFQAEEEKAIAAVEAQYATELADDEFYQAMQDARDLAELRNDPILQSPDWPLKLVERVKAKFSTKTPTQDTSVASPPSFPAKPQQAKPVRGALESPTATMTMSVDDALGQLDSMTEEQIDAVLKSINTRQAKAQ